MQPPVVTGSAAAAPRLYPLVGSHGQPEGAYPAPPPPSVPATPLIPYPPARPYAFPPPPTDLAALASTPPSMELTPRDFANVSHLWVLLKEGTCSPRLYARFHAWSAARRQPVPAGWGKRPPSFTDQEWQEYYDAATASTLADALPSDPTTLLKLSLPYWPKRELPSFVWKMTWLRELHCYGSQVNAVSPLIGNLRSLEFSPYTSYGLRWLPYEIKHTGSKKAHISCRALYAPKPVEGQADEEELDAIAWIPLEPPFPRGVPSLKELICRHADSLLGDVTLPHDLVDFLQHPTGYCSACVQPYWTMEYRVWVVWSYDGVPLLARLCSRECADQVKACNTVAVWDGAHVPVTLARGISTRCAPSYRRVVYERAVFEKLAQVLPNAHELAADIAALEVEAQ